MIELSGIFLNNSELGEEITSATTGADVIQIVLNRVDNYKTLKQFIVNFDGHDINILTVGAQDFKQTVKRRNEDGNIIKQEQTTETLASGGVKVKWPMV